MSRKNWEKKVLSAPGASRRVAEAEKELRLATSLAALRDGEGLSQRDLARRIGVTQPRIAAIEASRNVTVDVLDKYVTAVGGVLEVNVVKGGERIPLLTAAARPKRRRSSGRAPQSA
jgi:transcriptional regulator with XRE-family HTH domain